MMNIRLPNQALQRPWPLYCLALIYENTSIASHTRSGRRWLILVASGGESAQGVLNCRVMRL